MACDLVEPTLAGVHYPGPCGEIRGRERPGGLEGEAVASLVVAQGALEHARPVNQRRGQSAELRQLCPSQCAADDKIPGPVEVRALSRREGGCRCSSACPGHHGSADPSQTAAGGHGGAESLKLSGTARASGSNHAASTGEQASTESLQRPILGFLIPNQRF